MRFRTSKVLSHSFIILSIRRVASSGVAITTQLKIILSSMDLYEIVDGTVKQPVRAVGAIEAEFAKNLSEFKKNEMRAQRVIITTVVTSR